MGLSIAKPAQAADFQRPRPAQYHFCLQPAFFFEHLEGRFT
jgi:hypothetical protein